MSHTDTYRISTYDPDDDPERDGAWTVRESGLGLMALRGPLRELRAGGYSDDISILVEREATTP